MAVGLVIAPPMVAAVVPMLASIAIALSLPAALACAPMLWFFSCALNSEQPWRLERGALWHLLLPASGMVIALTAIAMPRALREALLLLRGELVDSVPVLVLVAFVLVIGTVWVFSVASLLLDNLAGQTLLSGRAAALLGFVLVGFLALWGLRQQPGFAGRYLPPPPHDELPTPPTAKYQRSALDAERAERIGPSSRGR